MKDGREAEIVEDEWLSRAKGGSPSYKGLKSSEYKKSPRELPRAEEPRILTP